MLNQAGYSIRAACEVAKLSRSSYYYRASEVEEGQLEAAIEDMAGQFPTSGTRRVTHQLRRPPYQMQVNRKRVQRLMAQKKLLRPVKRSKKRTTASLPIRALSAPGQRPGNPLPGPGVGQRCDLHPAAA